MLEKVKEAFDKYTNNYDMTNKNIRLKYEHSYAVMDLMGELAFRLNLDKEKIELAKIIGLLHDIGRFEQLKEYNSFSDDNIDHGDYGADYLFKENNIKEFLDTDEYNGIIEKAIRYHNKLDIPKGLDNLELLFTQMIRDMDKVDIFKQVALKYEIVFNSNEVTEKVLKDFSKEKLVNKRDVKTDTDSNLETLSFIFDINFNESFDILVDTDNFDLYLSMVEVDENSEKLWKKVREVCFDKINRGV